MIFNSLPFLWFFLVVYAVYRLLPFRWRAQNLFLVAAGYVFYGWWDWRFLALLAASTLIDYTAGLALGRTQAPGRRRLVLGIAVGCNLAILGFFKYFNFFADSLAALLAVVGLEADLPTLRVILPVGISFYTFQSMAYAIDVYRRAVPPERNLADYALYVAFFPQLMAGPIERAGHMLPQISRPRKIGADDLGSGGFLVLLGLFKKVCIADNLAPIVDAGFRGSGPAAAGPALAAVAFALQIYGDFAGYSDMARGLARLLGFRIIRNFDVPYAARTASEFWRRWHISLSSWLRDYLFIPLGGSRGSRLRTGANLMTTMLLGGLWHGANWTFVLWGAYHGVLLVLYRGLARAGIVREEAPASRFTGWCSRAVLFALVALGWILFRADGLGRAGAMLAGALSHPFSGAAGPLLPVAVWGGCQVALDRWTLRAGDDVFVRGWPQPARLALVLLLYYAVVLFGAREEHAFIYFQF